MLNAKASSLKSSCAPCIFIVSNILSYLISTGSGKGWTGERNLYNNWRGWRTGQDWTTTEPRERASLQRSTETDWKLLFRRMFIKILMIFGGSWSTIYGQIPYLTPTSIVILWTLAFPRPVQLLNENRHCCLLRLTTDTSVLCYQYLRGKEMQWDVDYIRAPKLLQHATKVIEHVFERRIREKVKIDDMQFRFRLKKGIWWILYC